MSTGSPKKHNVPQIQEEKPQIKSFFTRGLPEPKHPAIPGPLSRLEGVPGYKPEAVQNTRIALLGAGGLGSWIGIGLVRTGIGSTIIIIDHDRYELSNANRQLVFKTDIGEYKAFALARNLLPHAVRETSIIALALPFAEALLSYPLAVNLAVVGVDNAKCRLEAAAWARRRNIPAVFAMLSRDGTRLESFYQGPAPQDACFHCCYPDLDPQRFMRCAFASISSCFLASAFTLFFCERALMGWDEQAAPFNWRTADLRGLTPECIEVITQRPSCPTCSKLKQSPEGGNR